MLGDKQDQKLTKGLGSPDKECWYLLQEDVSLPVAVIYQSRLSNNIHWMQSFADKMGVKLAPHGKTTMSTDFFQRQLEAGAWATTLATAPQVSAAYHAGLKRIMMANQLVGKRNMELIAELLSNKDFEFYCLVDSVANVEQLGRFFTQANLPLNLLIEIGVPGGRCGCRSAAQIADIVTSIAEYPSLKLAGIEVYEGVIHGDNAEAEIRSFLAGVIQTTTSLLADKAFDTRQVILTGAGSAWYDVVADSFVQAELPAAIVPVIRPGCYIIHDTGIYLDAQSQVMARSQAACDLGGDLESSLEIWAYIQSIPEPGHAIIGMGKRDVAFDAGLPVPELHFRPGDEQPVKASSDWKVTAIMDQHAYLAFPADTELQVGDMLAFSTSHPCLTFDKWQNIAVINDDYQVEELVSTSF